MAAAIHPGAVLAIRGIPLEGVTHGRHEAGEGRDEAAAGDADV